MKLKRYLSILMALCMVLTLLPVGTLATETEGEPELVDGYYEIYTADQLYWFAEQVNSGNTAINGRLMADIVVNENVLDYFGDINGDGSDFREWTPIGHNISWDGGRYEGIFDGNWMSISGLYFNDETASNVGLFGGVDYSGEIWNLYIEDCYFAGRSSVGGVAGDNFGTVNNSTVGFCSIRGSSEVGGVVGCNDGGSVSCNSNWSHVQGNSFVGGIVGLSRVGGIIEYCINEGLVYASDQESFAGGIVGTATGNTVSCCENSGTIEGQYFVGGIVGHNYDNQTFNCHNKGSVCGIGASTGGIAGQNDFGTVDNCFNEGWVYQDDLPEEQITVWVSVDGDFTPYAWAWDMYFNTAFDQWPGEPMEKDGDLWKIQIPVGYTGFIVNDGGYRQTDDIAIDGYMDCLITVSGDFSEATVSYDGFDENQHVRPKDGGGIAGVNNGDVTNCYYVYEHNRHSNDVGTPKTYDECGSGEVAYLLQGQQERPIWGQDLLWDTMPSLHGPRVEPVYDQEENIIGFQNEVIPSVTGSVTSYLNNAEVTIELLQDGMLVDGTVVYGKNAEFEFYEVGAGTYTLRISKDNHPTREYEVVAEAEDVFVEAELCPYGDVTGDGNINVKDFQRLLRHVNKTNPLTGYALACGDVTGDGNANIKDFQRLLRHVNKTGLLYPETKDVTIKVWAPSEDLSWGYGWMQQMQSRFEAMHPEYSITWVNEAVPEGDVGTYVIQDAQSAADVYMYTHDMQYRLVQAGGLMPLTGAYADQVRNDNIQLGVNSVTHTDGQLYGFPMENNTWFLYYDNRVFTEEDVTNLDVMLEKGRVSLPYDNAWMAGAFFLGCGGTLFGENGLDADAGIDFSGSNGGYMAAKKMVELAQHPNAQFGAYNIGGMVDGTVDAIFSGSWDAATLRDIMGDALGVAMLPKFTIDGEEYQMTAMSGTKCVGVNPYADDEEGKLELCMEFASFLASEEGQLERYEMRGAIPTHKNLADNEVIQADAVAMAEINTMRYASVLHPGLDEMSNYWGPMGSFGAAVVMGDVTLENYKQMVDELVEAFHAWW